MDARDHLHVNLPSAREDAEHAQPEVVTPQTRSPSYRLAFADQDFLLRDELRPVRLQLELLKPELELQAHGIESTIVIFGSARIAEPAIARARREEAERLAAQKPADKGLQRQLKIARNLDRLSRHYEEARRFGRLVAEANRRNGTERFVITTGGGPGVMEAANRGALEAGADTIGHNIVLPHEQAPNRYITPELCFRFHYFALRKMHLLTRARALVIFPGGFGTMDELFETLCLIQTGKARPMPVLLFDAAYWKTLVNFEAMVDAGVIDETDLDIFRFVESAEEAWHAIEEHYREGKDEERRADGPVA
ncbi:TIGR00730 family Rossman fold protein [Geminicoccaceae bacterium 1502E]|nr:TIGR00730 family Rossman fold protein [Geminicoccaceae bacterium 1502E]